MSMAVARRTTLAATLALAAAAGAFAACNSGSARVPAPAAAAIAADRISDSTFWRMVTELSEPGGYFRSDNFVSNEVTYQHVIPDLTRTRAQGGVYLGVGPDQNFTYLVALRPRIAFIVDIRRQNMLQHLLYKALIERSADRAEFLSLLFSRPRPRGLSAAGATPEALFEAYSAVAADSGAFRRNMAAVKERLVRTHGFALTEDDLRSLEYVYGAFLGGGPELTYTPFPMGQGGGAQLYGGWRRMPSYAALMVESDSAGVQRSYLASEENFAVLKELETKNLVIPLVGDFAGPHALGAIGQYLRDRRLTVTAFYTSNVEQYLFRQGDDWRRFFANVAALPVDSASTFIRAVFNFGVAGRGPMQMPMQGPRSVTLLAPIAEQLRAFEEGRIQSYYDVVQPSP
ncbi:MAG TPA: hypothetical protein VKA84_28700 [Gemmatimonadaceae bacterium]|nr:hypothetical protein [Gemmatimonadaceae bacterium]